MKDQELLERLKNADPAERDRAFKWLYNSPAVRGNLMAICKANGLNRDQADDVLQDAMLALNQNVLLGRFRGDSAVTTYLYKICKFIVFARVRKLGKSPVAVDDFETGGMAGAVAQVSMANFEPVFEPEKHEMDAVLLAELASIKQGLSEKCKKLLALKYLEDLSMVKIAGAMNQKTDEPEGQNLPDDDDDDGNEISDWTENKAKKHVDKCRNSLRERCKKSSVFRQAMAYLNLKFREKKSNL